MSEEQGRCGRVQVSINSFTSLRLRAYVNYSQGAALIAGSITPLSATIKSQIVGVVLFGYTKNQQNNGQIPSYPKEQTKVFCNATDGVCGGSLIVTAGHLTYQEDVAAAAQFLEGTVGGA